MFISFPCPSTINCMLGATVGMTNFNEFDSPSFMVNYKLIFQFLQIALVRHVGPPSILVQRSLPSNRLNVQPALDNNSKVFVHPSIATRFLGDSAKILTPSVLLLKNSSSGILINLMPLFFNTVIKSIGNSDRQPIAKS